MKSTDIAVASNVEVMIGKVGALEIGAGKKFPHSYSSTLCQFYFVNLAASF